MRIALAAVVAVALVPALPAAAQAQGCSADPRYRAADFWLGEWQLEQAGRSVGRSRVEARADGCLVVERWSTDVGRSGESFLFLDRSSGRWQLAAVDSDGSSFLGEGGPGDGGLRFEGRKVSASGESTRMVEVLTPVETGGLRWSEQTPEGVLRGEVYYRPPGQVTERAPAPELPAVAPEPAPRRPVEVIEPPPEPEPAPEPAPAVAEEGAVRSLSPTRRRPQQVEVDSPMILEVELGPIDALPEGYGWSTSDTAGYVCQGATIRRVEVKREQRRGRLRLPVSLAIHGEGYSSRFGLEVELRDGEEVVASATDPSFPVGRGLPQQVNEGAVTKELVLELERDVFERLFSSESRPTLRLTLTAR